MRFIVLTSAIALVAGCSHKPPAPLFKPNGAHVFVLPEGLGDIDFATCAGKVVPLEPAQNIAQSLGVGLARAGFRSVLALEDDILVVEPTIHVHACKVDEENVYASGDLTLDISKGGHVLERIVYDARKQTPGAWIKGAVGAILASKAVAAALAIQP